MKNQISVIMPAFNNKNLDKNVLEVKKELEKFVKNYEIIVVNDGSLKGWDKELKKLMRIKNKDIKIISYNKNMGKGYALKTGGLSSKGEIVVFLDSDLDISPDNIKNLIRALDKADIVIGSKRHPLSKIDYPFSRKVMSFFYQKLIFLLFGLDVKDTQVGLKVFKGEVLKKVLPRLLVKRYAFDLELLVVANKEKYKVIEGPIKMNFKLGSTINLKSVFHILLDTGAIFYRLKILKYYNRK